MVEPQTRARQDGSRSQRSEATIPITGRLWSGSRTRGSDRRPTYSGSKSTRLAVGSSKRCYSLNSRHLPRFPMLLSNAVRSRLECPLSYTRWKPWWLDPRTIHWGRDNTHSLRSIFGFDVVAKIRDVVGDLDGGRRHMKSMLPENVTRIPPTSIWRSD